jgi:hypothetical protein
LNEEKKEKRNQNNSSQSHRRVDGSTQRANMCALCRRNSLWQSNYGPVLVTWWRPRLHPIPQRDPSKRGTRACRFPWSSFFLRQSTQPSPFPLDFHLSLSPFHFHFCPLLSHSLHLSILFCTNTPPFCHRLPPMRVSILTENGDIHTIEVDSQMELENIKALLEADVKYI